MIVLDITIGEYLHLVQWFMRLPVNIQDLVTRFPPGSEWQRLGDTTGDWYVPESFNGDGTLRMYRILVHSAAAFVEDHVHPSELIPLVTH